MCRNSFHSRLEQRDIEYAPTTVYQRDIATHTRWFINLEASIDMQVHIWFRDFQTDFYWPEFRAM